jgi:hypothetical protein
MREGADVAGDGTPALMANWWDGVALGEAYNNFQVMMHALVDTQLVAAWSMKFNIAWSRLIVAMIVLGCMMLAAAYLDQKARPKKK